MRMAYDIIVAGAGPGGATAAYELARRGVRVGSFDKHRFPRAKPCGGCLSLKIDRLLEPGLHALVERTIHGVRFTFEGLRPVRRHSARPVAYMVQRERFDAWLVARARAAGAEVHEGEAVRAVHEHADHVEVETTQGRYRARFLIGADGATGIVARDLGLRPGKRIAVALDGEVTVPPQLLETLGDEVWVDFGAIPYGYGWVFPKGAHLSVGIGGLKDQVKHPRDLYEAYLEDEGLLAAIEHEERRGYILPIFDDGRTPRHTARALLVGDAAALVDPFLGEGIYYAIRSGQLAAETVHGALTGLTPLDGYDALLNAELYPAFRAARKMSLLLYTFPETGYDILTRQAHVTDRYFEVLRGERPYDDMWDTLKRAAARHIMRTFWPIGHNPRDLVHYYDRLAPRYDRRLRLWHALIGPDVWEHLGTLLAAHVREGAAVLDAGTGTGEVVKLLLERANPGEIIAVDQSKGMLRQARKKIQDPRVTFAEADVRHLPYPDRRFDVAVCAWTLEMLVQPQIAVAELLRVIKDDGYVIYAFASAPAAGLERFYAALLERLMHASLRWRFLSKDDRPYHDCAHSSLATFAHGLSTVVVLRKCCTVAAPVLPCLDPAGAVP
jgi:geranylgeranyl reductase family protein